LKQTYFIGAGVLVALLAGLGGSLLRATLSSSATEAALSGEEVVEAHSMVGRLRPEFILADLAGAPRRVTEWDGQVLIINFWATWCPPCRKEMPMLIGLQEHYGRAGVQLVGIALDEPRSVQAYSKAMGINYPILIGDSGTIVSSYGNDLGALPYTVIIGRDSKIALVKLGELSREETEKAIRALL
jgi:thiol-disulfide isomerase/thioredoxin